MLLLQELVKNTQEEHSDLQNLKVALEKMKEISQYLNDRKHQAENLAKVIQIQNNLVNGIPIVEPHR